MDLDAAYIADNPTTIDIGRNGDAQKANARTDQLARLRQVGERRQFLYPAVYQPVFQHLDMM